MNGGTARRLRCGAKSRSGGRFSGEIGPKLLVVSGSFLAVEQTNPRGGHFVQKPLGQFAMLAALKRPQMGRLAVGRIIDHVTVGLEQPQAEQPIEVRRLLFRRNAEPNMIGIEICRHRNPPCLTRIVR